MCQTIRMFTGKSQVNELLATHFQGFQLATLVAAARRFPLASRVVVAVALDDFVQQHSPTRLWDDMLDSITKRLALKEAGLK